MDQAALDPRGANPVKLIDAVGTAGLGAQVLAAAPGTDTGQPGLAVRVISQLGAGGGGGGGAVTVADGADVAQGAVADAANANTLMGQLKGINAKLGASVAVTAAALPLPTGAATETTLTTLATHSDLSLLTGLISTVNGSQQLSVYDGRTRAAIKDLTITIEGLVTELRKVKA